MIKKIKKVGSSNVITLNKEELEAYDLKVGDFIDISFFKILANKNVRPIINLTFENRENIDFKALTKKIDKDIENEVKGK